MNGKDEEVIGFLDDFPCACHVGQREEMHWPTGVGKMYGSRHLLLYLLSSTLDATLRVASRISYSVSFG